MTHAPLFIKTVTKGFAGIYDSFEDFLDITGDLSLLSYESKNIIASEVIDIKKINARVDGKIKITTDEWRHFVYKNKLITSTHAFDCDRKYTDNSGYKGNVNKAKNLINSLADSDFSSTYVLDTCTLSNGKVEAIEVNNFFSSGIYSKFAVNDIAKSLTA